MLNPEPVFDGFQLVDEQTTRSPVCASMLVRLKASP